MVRSLHVLHVTPFFPPDKGGIAHSVISLCKCLSDLGINVSIVAPKKYGKPVVSNDIFKVHRINSIYFPGWPYPTLKSFSVPVDLWRTLKKIIINGEYNIIHVHGHHYPLSWFALDQGNKLRIPTILTLHGMYALNPHVLGGKSTVENWFNQLVFSRILSKTRVVVGGTTGITGYAEKYGSTNTKFRTIPTGGINIESFVTNRKNRGYFRSKYNLHHDSIVILFVGRLEVVKGITEFMKAMERISENERNIEVMIVGDGSLKKQVQLSTEHHPQIHFIPWQPSHLIHEIYIASDIFVIPSRFEAFPLTLIEAMNAGLYIIYTPVGGIPEILAEYNPKSLIHDVSDNSIKKEIDNVISMIKISEIHPTIEYAQQFSWVRISKQINNLYSEIMHNS